MYRIIYLSCVSNTLNENQLQQLFTQSKESNTLNNITGILLHIDGDFIQVLEGNEADVTELYKKISTDNRHKGIMDIVKGPIEKRQFEDWSMGFKSTKYVEINKIEGLKDFNHSTLFSANERVALVFLNTFLNSHKNNY